MLNRFQVLDQEIRALIEQVVNLANKKRGSIYYKDSDFNLRFTPASNGYCWFAALGFERCGLRTWTSIGDNPLSAITCLMKIIEYKDKYAEKEKS